MQNVPLMLASADEVGVIAVGGSMAIALVGIIAGSIRGAIVSKHREQTKREIAAYIAEGSMTPEQGEKILNAGKKTCS